MSEIRDCLKSTGSSIYTAIGDHLFDLQVTAADLAEFENGLADVFEPDDFESLGLTDGMPQARKYLKQVR